MVRARWRIRSLMVFVLLVAMGLGMATTARRWDRNARHATFLQREAVVFRIDAAGWLDQAEDNADYAERLLEQMRTRVDDRSGVSDWAVRYDQMVRSVPTFRRMAEKSDQKARALEAEAAELRSQW